MLQLTTILFLVSFSTLAIIHGVATQLYLYWSLQWLDMPMHLFGGAVVALGYFTLRDLGLFPNTWLRLVPIVLLVCAVAVAWEVFEAVFGIAKEANYLSDTLIDLILGLFGAVIGFFIGNSVRSLR